jgi:hypothetical protein
LDERVFKLLSMTATRRESPDEIVLNRAVGDLWLGRCRDDDFTTTREQHHCY